MAGIFKAYDIRGVYGETLTEDLIYEIGRAFVTFLKCRKVVAGHDMRKHSEPLFAALCCGLTEQGADVINLGLCSTPMSYFANGHLNADAGIMLTASHNTGEWNGVKLSRAKAIPISGDTGIRDIEEIVKTKSFPSPPEKSGSISKFDIKAQYKKHLLTQARISKPLKIAADMANGMGAVEAEVLEDVLNVTPLFKEMDGTFPNHEANPLKNQTYTDLQKLVKQGGYDFGVAFDGDADRVGFVDENGVIISMDMITALIAEDLLTRENGVILYDLRSSRAVKEVIEQSGGIPLRSRVGHAFIKQQMRENDAVFAGELSGHYYFKHNFFTESASLAVISVANILSRSGKTLSELIKPLQRYYASGEINSTVENPEKTFDLIRKNYSDGNLFELDGVSVEYDDWWFNVRSSNTEPLIRLNLEASSKDKMEMKRDELLNMIRS